MAQPGLRTFNEMIGRSELLRRSRAIEHYKALGLDFTRIFYQPQAAPNVGKYCSKSQDHGLENSLDVTTLLDLCKPAIENGTPVRATLPIRNVNRVVGTITGSELTRKHG